MSDRNYRESRARRGAHQCQSSQETSLTGEQASQPIAGPGTRTLTTKKGMKPTVTLQDGSVVDAEKAVCAWELLKDFPREEPSAFQWLLAQALGRTSDAEARYYPQEQMNPSFVNEDHTIESVTRAVLVNSLSTADGTPMIAALRLNSAADKAVLEEVRAQLHQQNVEGWARAISPGGWFDQMIKNMKRDQGKGQSID